MKIVQQISKKEYDRLLKYLKEEGKLLKDNEKLLYKLKLLGKEDKKIKIQGNKKEFSKTKKLLKELGYKIKIIKRKKYKKFKWEKVTITLYQNNLNKYYVEIELRKNSDKKRFDENSYKMLDNILSKLLK